MLHEDGRIMQRHSHIITGPAVGHQTLFLKGRSPTHRTTGGRVPCLFNEKKKLENKISFPAVMTGCAVTCSMNHDNIVTASRVGVATSKEPDAPAF